MEFKKDKLAIIFLIILLVVGTYLRSTEYDAIGYPHDSLLTIAGAVAWFYPHSYFPGFIYMGPPLGNMIIGVGCMLSGEDFSGISQAHQLFSPDLPILIGQQMVNAEPYCKIPIHLFGLIFFLLLSLLSIMLFRSYYALFPIAFFTFSQFILEWSRVISVDVISYVFIFLGLIFLWRAYNEEKESKKESLFFILTFISLGFAGATKFSAGIYPLFAVIILFEKYWEELKLLIKKILTLTKISIAEKINVSAVNLKHVIKIGIISFIGYIIALLIPFNLSPKNLVDTVKGFKALESSFVGLSPSLEIFN
ncbi:MAG: phospholipid carrier-dependent glycosyltransferase, partial [Nanoarchaeota archaeon]